MVNIKHYSWSKDFDRNCYKYRTVENWHSYVINYNKSLYRRMLHVLKKSTERRKWGPIQSWTAIVTYKQFLVCNIRFNQFKKQL